MSYELVQQWTTRSRDEQLRRVVERGRTLRLRRRAAGVLAGLAVASMLPVATAAVLDAAGGEARVRTVPADAPITDQDVTGGSRGADDVPAGTSEMAPAPGLSTRVEGGQRRGGLRGVEPASPAPSSGDGPGASGHGDGDGHSHVHDRGCNVVGGPVGAGVGDHEEEYLAVTHCDYWPSEPGGYVASGLEWQAIVERDGERFTVSPKNGSRPCEPVGFFRPGDRVRLVAEPGSSIAAGARYGCG